MCAIESRVPKELNKGIDHIIHRKDSWHEEVSKDRPRSVAADGKR